MNAIKYNFNKAISLLSSKLMNNGVNCYWWNGKTNFGDLLTPELLRCYGKTPIHQFPAQHNKTGIVMVGSLIQMLPQNYRGNIVGTGLIEPMPYSLPDATIRSVRGELTKLSMGLAATLPTGDFGLLADKLLSTRPGKSHALGLIPHYVDKNNPLIAELVRQYPQDILLIDVERSAKAVIHDVARCRMIASSSLHGIIVADALDIPNLWLKISDDVVGNGFKFHDYHSAIDTEQQPVSLADVPTLLSFEQKMQTKNATVIANKKASMEKLLQDVLHST